VLKLKDRCRRQVMFERPAGSYAEIPMSHPACVASAIMKLCVTIGRGPFRMSSLGQSPPSGATQEEMQQRIAELVDAVAAHELRNPMTPMMGHVDLLLSGIRAAKYSPEQIEGRLERIRQVMGHYLKRAEVATQRVADHRRQVCA
jgi:hypothetical protein